MSKVVAGIARIASISSFYIKFGNRVLYIVPKVNLYGVLFEKIHFFSGKMKIKNFPFLEEQLFSSSRVKQMFGFPVVVTSFF